MDPSAAGLAVEVGSRQNHAVHRELQLKIKVQGRHPWFYRKMIKRPGKPIPAGSAVRVSDRDGKFVGCGFYNGRTEKALRILDHRDVADPDALLLQRLNRAIDYRDKELRLPRQTNAYRLLHGEGDLFPGLVLDRLGTSIVAQVRSLCMQQRMEPIGEQLLQRFPGSKLLLTVDETARKLEGMAKAPPLDGQRELIREHGISYEIFPGMGHKTGFFADQRDHRLLVATVAKNRRVLDLCCNSGGFAMNAAKAGAKSVLAIDLDERAIDQVRANFKRNRLKGEALHGDAFEYLRACASGKFDLFILDPPRWAAHKSEVEQAGRRYRDLNELAFSAAKPGSLILTCSCSGPLSEDRFLSILRQAAARAGRDLRIRYLGGAAADHPVALECPETRYLKVLLLEVV